MHRGKRDAVVSRRVRFRLLTRFQRFTVAAVPRCRATLSEVHVATKHAKGRVTLHHGDCLDVIRGLPDCSVDSVCTDPPYGLNFMGKHWDDGAIAFNVVLWKECLRVLKPGGHLVAFGGTRKWHRLAVAIEDAGFEIRDNLAWLYGSGFPKSSDVSKAIDKSAGAKREVVGRKSGRGGQPADDFRGGRFNSTATDLFRSARRAGTKKRIDCVDITAPATDAAKQWAGWGTALKPAFEPIVLARKPLSGTVAANVLAQGVGGLNIDACRVGASGGTVEVVPKNAVMGKAETTDAGKGRWPANVLLDDHAAALVDEQSGKSTSRRGEMTRKLPVGVIMNAAKDEDFTSVRGHNDSGGASRFFPVFRYQAKAPTRERPDVAGVRHATVKPLALMQWLVRLITPPGGTVLEPFAGSGTTVEACMREGVNVVAIEREAEYLPLIKARIKRAS